MSNHPQGTQRAVKWYPPGYDIRVETVPIPEIVDPDDAIVKIKLAGLCGSDLHIYRGHEDVDAELICGHELVGEVVALGSSFYPGATGRPELYSTLKIGDKVVSPFTVSCGECHFCRVGFTCRCIHSTLFGIPILPGGQAQYARIPKAGGTLFSLTALATSNARVLEVADSSLLLLADILPTGVFAALQTLQHPKLSPMLTGLAYPSSSFVPSGELALAGAGVMKPLEAADRTLTIAIVGLGPVGVCAAVSLLHMMENVRTEKGLDYRVLAVDPNESRRKKMEAVYATISRQEKQSGAFVVAAIDEAKQLAKLWTGGAGCNAVLEIVGNTSALELAYSLVRPFGIISSVGVHQEPPLPFTGRDVYNKNVSLDFGRCPVRAMFPLALEVLVKRQDVFGGIGEDASLIEKVVSFDEAAESYELFDKGKCGKILFDPWR
ncbi:chaperonin 10-like protein [Fomitopsis serialis]|uniref:chaperonin 10-like protein n=1 Tax=Fomitopsis serialis TaxID=139415 RepID=UPI002007EAF4|nr:chaperonin 10-like protein [Neoantrodia serialis]KAH9915625.1 chaperonin 10-like protein [Neoantrodia serialis]